MNICKFFELNNPSSGCHFACLARGRKCLAALESQVSHLQNQQVGDRMAPEGFVFRCSLPLKEKALKVVSEIQSSKGPLCVMSPHGCVCMDIIQFSKCWNACSVSGERGGSVLSWGCLQSRARSYTFCRLMAGSCFEFWVIRDHAG